MHRYLGTYYLSRGWGVGGLKFADVSFTAVGEPGGFSNKFGIFRSKIYTTSPRNRAVGGVASTSCPRVTGGLTAGSGP